MIHISRDELLKDIEKERKNIVQIGQHKESNNNNTSLIDDMSSILPKTCTNRMDNNNNISEEDEVQAVIITGEYCIEKCQIFAFE